MPGGHADHGVRQECTRSHLATWRAGLVLGIVLGLVGCASTPGGSAGPSGGGAAPAPRIERIDRDGPPASPPPNLADVPDAEPRVEVIRPGGANKPYEIAGQRYEPLAADVPYSERGLASWYGRKFHGRPTASGEPYDMYAMTAAHPTLPIPSYVRVRNPANGRAVVVRVNDRGPFHSHRVIDLSYTAALKLGLLRGVAVVEVERLTGEAIRTGAWRDTAPTAPSTPSQAVALVTASNASASTAPPPPPAPPAPPPAPTASAGPAPADPLTAPSSTSPAPAGNAAERPEAVVASPARGFWVQLGAFRQREGADRLRQRLSDDLSWLAPLLGVFTDRGELLRVQAGPYADRSEATRVAQRVRAAAALVPVVIERR